MSDSAQTFFPETLNEQIEKLAEYSDSLEQRFSELVKSEQRKYWSTIISVFGIFISVLSLIIIGLPKIKTDITRPFWEIVKINLAQLLPIAFVLAVFIMILRWVISRKY